METTEVKADIYLFGVPEMETFLQGYPTWLKVLVRPRKANEKKDTETRGCNQSGESKSHPKPKSNYTYQKDAQSYHQVIGDGCFIFLFFLEIKQQLSTGAEQKAVVLDGTNRILIVRMKSPGKNT